MKTGFLFEPLIFLYKDTVTWLDDAEIPTNEMEMATSSLLAG